jgi:hypothetical protein
MSYAMAQSRSPALPLASGLGPDHGRPQLHLPLINLCPASRTMAHAVMGEGRSKLRHYYKMRWDQEEEAMKFMLFVLPTVPGTLEDRKRLRPIGRNNERYQQMLDELRKLAQFADDVGFDVMATTESPAGLNQGATLGTPSKSRGCWPPDPGAARLLPPSAELCLMGHSAAR